MYYYYYYYNVLLGRFNSRPQVRDWPPVLYADSSYDRIVFTLFVVKIAMAAAAARREDTAPRWTVFGHDSKINFAKPLVGRGEGARAALSSIKVVRPSSGIISHLQRSQSSQQTRILIVSSAHQTPEYNSRHAVHSKHKLRLRQGDFYLCRFNISHYSTVAGQSDKHWKQKSPWTPTERFYFIHVIFCSRRLLL